MLDCTVCATVTCTPLKNSSPRKRLSGRLAEHDEASMSEAGGMFNIFRSMRLRRLVPKHLSKISSSAIYFALLIHAGLTT